jgi:hypothetical protein
MAVASDASSPASEFESPWPEQNNLSRASEADHQFFRTSSGSLAILAAIRRGFVAGKQTRHFYLGVRHLRSVNIPLIGSV